MIEQKQKKLTAGDGISISEDGVISVKNITKMYAYIYAYMGLHYVVYVFNENVKVGDTAFVNNFDKREYWLTTVTEVDQSFIKVDGMSELFSSFGTADYNITDLTLGDPKPW